MMRPYRFQTTAFRFLSLMLTCWILLSFSSLSGVFAQDGEVTSSESGAASEAGDHTIINFVDVDINAVIQYMHELTGKSFVIDNNVKGKVTVISKEKISPEDAYRLFEAVLDVNGFALVPSGKFIKVLPVAEARTKSIETRVNAQQLSKDTEDVLVTQLISLKYADAKEVKTLFTPLVSKNSVILPYSDTNTLIVTDVESNIKRLIHILNTIDVPGIGRQVSFTPLTYADAETVTKILSSIFKTSMSEEKDTSQKTLQFVADQRTNSVIYVASEDDTNRIENLINLLDKETPVGKGGTQVYHLKHAWAEDIAEVLNELPTGTSSTQEAGKETVLLSKDTSITPDKATNSLVIFADSADYAVLKNIIEELDIPRSMVYIEALIMSISVDKSRELGIEWSALKNTTIDGEDTVIGGGFNVSDGFDPTDLLSSSGGTAGALSGTADITTSAGTITIPSMGVLIKALQADEDVHILSTPKLLTTDNEEATIVVGKNVPYQTRASTTDNETYNNYDYKDVGLTLKITPHISEERNVTLQISQELSALTSASTDITTTPTTLTRKVDTTVIVKDQNMLVIGGLIDDNTTNKVTKVPLLGSIPILGRLFRYDSQIGSKTNLYIFITPRVVKNPAEAVQLTSDVKDTMSPVESGYVKMYSPTKVRENVRIPDTTEPSE